jgi:hypothetical protein
LAALKIRDDFTPPASRFYHENLEPHNFLLITNRKSGKITAVYRKKKPSDSPAVRDPRRADNLDNIRIGTVCRLPDTPDRVFGQNAFRSLITFNLEKSPYNPPYVI